MSIQALDQLDSDFIHGSYWTESFFDFLDRVDAFAAKALILLREMRCDSKYTRLVIGKITNIMVAQYHFQNGHKELLSRPFGLIVDPSNSCPLRCPGCIHNDLLRNNNEVDWPSGLLTKEKFEKFIKEFGPYAISIHFFNWGEPFLNKLTPDFIRLAKKFGLTTVVSSNLNVKIDAKALVQSGLDFLVMSIDGVSETTYNRYRRGGRLDKAISNIRNIVAAKKKYASSTPWLQWQFLTFEHNIGEIDLAKETAKDLGVNSIRFGEPYDVSWADPSIQINRDNLSSEVYISENTPGFVNKQFCEAVAESCNDEFSESWMEKARKSGDDFCNSSVKSKCSWLYKNMVMDAHGRILPCCYAPKRNSEDIYVFPAFDDGKHSHDVFNTPHYLAARGDESCLNALDRKPFCSKCQDKIRPNIDTDQFVGYFKDYGINIDDAVWPSSKLISHLTKW